MTGAVNLTCDEVRDLAPMFVTGALDPDEMAAVRDHLAGCDDAHAELDELGESAAALLETVEPAEPSASLKPRLLAAAQADLDAGRHPSQAGAASAAVAGPTAAAAPTAPRAPSTPPS